MPVRVPDDLPAVKTLEQENIFVMTEKRASHQDIRPLCIGIMNLMPTKTVTETQLLRLLGNSPLQIDVVLIRPKHHKSKNTSEEYLAAFYRTFDEIKNKKFDGLIITGAPVELLDFEEVNYWHELNEIIDWADKNVYSTMYICWAAQAGLYYRHGIEKYTLPKKLSGIYKHRSCINNYPLMRGFDEYFFAPHSRNTDIRIPDILANSKLDLVSVSDEAGAFIIAEKNGRHIYVTGHVEYDVDTLMLEYRRDIEKGLDIEMPVNYFPNGNPNEQPLNVWRSTGTLLFANWLNYYVYQVTPFDIEQVSGTSDI